MELVLNTYGTCLNRDNQGFVITNAELNELLCQLIMTFFCLP